MQKAVSYETAFDGIDYESQEFLEEAVPVGKHRIRFPGRGRRARKRSLRRKAADPGPETSTRSSGS